MRAWVYRRPFDARAPRRLNPVLFLVVAEAAVGLTAAQRAYKQLFAGLGKMVGK